jgi:hypothetical protein
MSWLRDRLRDWLFDFNDEDEFACDDCVAERKARIASTKRLQNRIIALEDELMVLNKRVDELPQNTMARAIKLRTE